jgi:hypothetical protein
LGAQSNDLPTQRQVNFLILFTTHQGFPDAAIRHSLTAQKHKIDEIMRHEKLPSHSGIVIAIQCTFAA